MGLRVTDLTAYWAGPFCTKFLADFGAEVIKVESPTHPDIVRITLTSRATHGTEYYNKSSYFNNYSRNKLSIGLDITTPQGRDIVMSLVRVSDIFVENLRADVMDKLGFGYPALRDVNPGIIALSLSAFGKSGPLRSFAGIGTTMEQMSGLASLNTYGDDIPYNTGIAYGDPNAGVMGFGAIIMALLHRDRTGEGSYIDLSQQENLITLFGEQLIEYFLNNRNPVAHGNGSDSMVPHGCYPCSGEDRWLAVAVQTDEQWKRLAELIGKPELFEQYSDLPARLHNRHEIDAQISMWSVSQNDREAAELLQNSGIPASPVQDALDHVDDEHLRAREFFAMLDDQDLGRWPYDGIAWKLSQTPGSVRAPAPRFAQHNDYVLRELLGLVPDAIDKLRSAGVVADAF